MRRRAILVIILSCLLVAIGFTDESVNAATDHDNRYMNTFLNGEALILDPIPVIINKEVLVPARQLFERLGYKVEWNESDETIHAERGLSRIDLRINGGVGDANGMQFWLFTSPLLIDGVSYIPLDFLEESTGTVVKWEDDRLEIQMSTEARITEDERIAHWIELYAFSFSANTFARSYTGKNGAKFEEVEIESVQVDPSGKKGSATYRLRYSFSSVSYSKNPQPSQFSETTLQITDQLIRDEYGHWLFDWNSRDTQIVEDKLLK
ncbi:hypothetical protein YDYSG_40220 [Paenibacillus tyrfis]|uniref:copper amine oxidase N-terminal domain-containing protein n=1 Tax=Paenibacillus tyrfis TaxID=1501230 RepID=UPI00249358EC|nr:copper amine oxidase N-terminal domain-containing protein [Paenibacillus tyrfis]GLI07992.1 hypothetical protein YDYSG_40220 [Paenibacillus tyrfis]